MRRREFITLLSGAVTGAPFAADAQQRDGVRRIGIFMNLAADDPESATRLAAFTQSLRELGWTDGVNLRIDYRWGAGDADRYRHYAPELIALAPDVILAAAGPIVGLLQQATRTVPIVFVQAIDPIGGGGIASLSRPGGNTTGFASSDYRIGEKRLELLKQIAPKLTRAVVIRDPATAAGAGQFDAIQAVAPLLKVELTGVDVRDAGERERSIAAFAREPNGGLIVTTSTSATVERDALIALAERYRLPAIYPTPLFVAGGGLMSYGSDVTDQYRLAAGYVDRILRGTKPSDLPVQQAARFVLGINLKTAKKLGIEVPRLLLARAEHVVD